MAFCTNQRALFEGHTDTLMYYYTQRRSTYFIARILIHVARGSSFLLSNFLVKYVLKYVPWVGAIRSTQVETDVC